MKIKISYFKDKELNLYQAPSNIEKIFFRKKILKRLMIKI